MVLKQTECCEHYSFSKVHIFSLVYDKLNRSWQIDYIGKLPDVKTDADGNPFYYTERYLELLEYPIIYAENISLYDDSFDGNAKITKYFVRSDNTIEYKKIYGEIVPMEYRGVLNSLYKTHAFIGSSLSLYFFD